MSNLAEALPKEQSRCRGLLVQYEKIGQPGQFGAAMIRQRLSNAERAAASGDVVAMLKAYEALKGCE